MKKPIIVNGNYVENFEALLEVITTDDKNTFVAKLQNILYKYSLLSVEYVGREHSKSEATEAAEHIYLLKWIIDSVNKMEITQILEEENIGS